MQHTRTRARRALASFAAIAALVASGIGLAAAPATAAVTSVTLSGVQSGGVNAIQNLAVTVTLSDTACGSILAPQVEMLGTLNNGGQQVLGVATSAGCSGNAFAYTYAWIPSTAGTWGIQASQSGVTSNTQTATIGSVGTTTTISAPNVATVGQPTTITVNVQSTGGSSYQPAGSVTVTTGPGGAVVTTMGLTPQGAGQSYAYWRWTPPATGTYTFQATYNPAAGASATGSTSAVDQVLASPNGNTITLNLPGSVTAGAPVNLSASVTPSTMQGSVGFQVNGAWVSASIPLVNGTATFPYTFPGPGTYTIGASYTTNQGGSGNTSQSLAVVAGPVNQDAITLTPAGGSSWSPNGTYNVQAGSNTTFSATTLSGSAVTLSETGPCSVSGLTLVPGPTGSTCNLVAKSAGGNGYAPVSYGYTVKVGIGQQTANVNPPVSGRVNKGKAIVLEGPGQGDTNAGQNIVWSVKKSSRSVCKLGFPADGSVTVKLVKKGSCTVTGKAPGVPGQWSPYAISRTYTA